MWVRISLAAILAASLAALPAAAQPLELDRPAIILQPQATPTLRAEPRVAEPRVSAPVVAAPLAELDLARPLTLPENLRHLEIKPNIELLYGQQPELRDILRRYPDLAQVTPSENAEVVRRFPGVTTDMLEALQHFNRTGLPQVVEIDPALLPQRFRRTLPDYEAFLGAALVAPSLDLTDTLGDQMLFQTVSPELAIQHAMLQPEAAEWLERVRAASGYGIDTLNTCHNAIWALFETTCGGQPFCEFEEAFAETCLGAPGAARARDCVAAVDVYYDLCFGGICPISDADWPAAILGAPDDVACSAALIHADADDTVVATVDHCEAFVAEGAHTRIGQSDIVYAPVAASDYAALGLTEQAAAFYILPDRVGAGARPAAPEKFAVTVLLAYNRVLDLRNQVVARFGLSTEPIKPLTCDASVLCTVTDLRADGTLDHTCQSTRGGSGGALVQFEGDVPRVVGLNMGARTPGMVAFNLGVALGR